MSLQTIANKIACTGSSTGANTGKLGCLSLFGTPAHLLGFSKGFTMPAATDFNDAYIRPLVQTGDIIPLIDAASFEDVSAEDAYSTNTKGIKRLNLKGLPEYRLMFEEGHEFYRQIDKLESYKTYDWMIGDTDGNWMLVVKSDADFKAFEGGHTTPELTKRQVEGGDPEMKPLLIQFLNRREWDRDYVIIHAENLTLTPQEIPQINGVLCTFDSTPADLDVVVDITVLLASDASTGVLGLAETDFQFTVDTVVVAVTSIVDNGGGSYQLTVPALAAAQVVTIEMWDLTPGVNVADSLTVLYRAIEIDTETVT